MSRIHPIKLALSMVLSSLVSSRKVFVHGKYASALMMELTARLACRLKPVRYICGDNRFDPYQIARLARSEEVDQYSALSSVKIARPFTGYQLLEMVNRLDDTPSDELLIISGVCSQFYDDDIPLLDAARLFYRMLWRLIEHSRNGRQMLIVQGDIRPPARRAYFLRDLCRLSDVVLELSSENTFTIERRLRVGLPQLYNKSLT